MMQSSTGACACEGVLRLLLTGCMFPHHHHYNDNQQQQQSSLALNDDGVLVSAADNGTIKFWDYKTGYNFQTVQTIVQPGSLEAEAGIFASAFDHSGSRWLTCEADKTIKVRD
jgi:pleiotropic regulator 1